MGFFRRREEKRTDELTLADFDSIWTKFCFLDETGSLASGRDPFFTVGMLKMSQPYYLQSKIAYERNKRGFYDELKFNKLSRRNIDFAKFAVGAVFDTRSVRFSSYTVHKESRRFRKSFGRNPWKAYERITLRLLDAVLEEQEILMLIADHVTTPKDIRFEVDTKRKFNSSKRRLALAGVCRFDSKSNDLLQVVDLLVGAITYDLKVSQGILPGSKYKRELVSYLKQNLGASFFVAGFENRDFKIFVERMGK